jgi:hypothetical protein
MDRWENAVALFGVGGVLLTLWGLYAVLTRLWVLYRGTRTFGTIVGHRTLCSLWVSPRVRFEANGEEVEIHGLSSDSPTYETGGQVEVVYPPDNPRAGVLVSGREVFLAWSPLVVGLGWLAVGYCIFLSANP